MTTSERRTYRVAVVAACPFPSLRGSQVLIRELAEGLANLGHAVHVVTYPTAQHMVPIQRIAIHRVAKLPGLWTARPFGWQKVVLDLMLVWLLYRVVRRERIDVIHAHNLEGPLVAYLVRALTGVPVVYHAHNALSDELPCYFGRATTRRLAGWAGRVLDRCIARWADFTIALSDRLGAFLCVRGAAGRIAIVPPAVDARRTAPAAVPAGDARPLIMYAGNLDPYQDLDLLLAGFERVCAVEPSARLVLVTHAGAHPKTTQRAELLARRPGVSVRVTNTFASACRELSRADVVVCPRSSWSGFPIKVLNYMGLGRPIVHARASAHAIRDGQQGLLFADGDPRALARAILRVVQDPALGMRLGHEARETVRQVYAWPRVLPLVERVYGRVAGGSPAELATEEGMQRMKERVSRDFAERPRPLAKDSSARGLSLLLGVLLVTATQLGCAAERAAPLPPLAVPSAPGAAADTDVYRLQPGDVLRVKFLYHPELDIKVPVGPDGSVTVQGVGKLPAQGKTAEELSKDIAAMSSDHLRNPEVTVIVAELGPRKVYVGGEVRLPGPVLYREGMTALQAILDRGGFTEVARTDSVLHLTIKDNSYQATRLNLSGNVDEGTPELRQLAVYDVIYVPRTFIGDANAFVRLYIRGLIPTIPRVGVGVTP